MGETTKDDVRPVHPKVEPGLAPVPWRVWDEFTVIEDESGQVVISCGLTPVLGVLDKVVRCVNSHDELLAICRIIAEEDTAPESGALGILTGLTRERLTAVIRKATRP